MELEWMRVLLAFFCGYFLALSGSLTQIVSQNNLASPSTLGFDGLAVITTLLAQFGISAAGISIPIEHLSFCIFIGIFSVIFFLSYRKKIDTNQKVFASSNIQVVILLGLGFNLLVGAVFSVVQFLFMAMNMDFPTGIWFGNFRYYDIWFLVIFTGIFVVSHIVKYSLGKHLRVMSIGSEFALGMGVKVQDVQKLSFLLSLFLTGTVISYFGVFSFLGLIFPHILRSLPIFKYNMKNEIYYGPYLSGVFLSVLDILCFEFDIYGAELPVGMVSSVLGALLLILLLVKSKLFRIKA